MERSPFAALLAGELYTIASACAFSQRECRRSHGVEQRRQTCHASLGVRPGTTSPD